MTAPLADGLIDAPRLGAPAEARRRLASLIETPAAADLAPELGRGRTRDVLLGLADHSPYLWALIKEDPARLARLLAGPARRIARRPRSGARPSGATTDEADLMRALRRAKRESALLIALADIGGVWDVVAATEALTRFADAAVGAALAFLLRRHGRAGLLNLDPDARDPQSGSGVVVLALGKHGRARAQLFERYRPDRPLRSGRGVDSAGRRAGAAVRAHDQGAGAAPAGAHERRLRAPGRPSPPARPRFDPGRALDFSAPIPITRRVGQNWERAALIKARPAAGDLKLGERFLADLAPFIWRKYFDYAAIADIHAMKRQIHAVRGHEQVVVPGHDIKLGRGGIREIEFFVQTQQLIFGGRRPQMRGARTLDMLERLHADKWVSAEAVDDLGRSYVFLRRRRAPAADGRRRADPAAAVRPAGARPLRQILRLCAARRFREGRHPSSDPGRASLRPAVRGRAGARASLPAISSSPASSTIRRRLRPCARSDSERPEAAAETVRGWHFGRRAAVRSPRAREVLTELTPALLEAFAGSGDPDAALAAFDEALARMPASVELLSILRSNAALRELFGDVLGAPRGSRR